MDNKTIKQYWTRLGFDPRTGAVNHQYIKDPAITSFYNNLVISGEDLYIDHLDFLDVFTKWITDSQYYNFDFIDWQEHVVRTQFECYSEARWRYRDRRLRIFRGEYEYMQDSFFCTGEYFDSAPTDVRQFPYIKYIDSLTGKYFDLDRDDWVFLTIPFHGTGDVDEKIEGMLNQADLLDIPVVVDCQLLPFSRDIDIDFSRPSIKEVIFTIGDNIGIRQVYSGIRYSRYTIEDDYGFNGQEGSPYIRALSGNYAISEVEMACAVKILEEFSIDYLYNTYRKAQLQICKDFNLTPTNCVNLCTAPDEEPWLSEWHRLNAYMLVDISHALSLKINNRYNI